MATEGVYNESKRAVEGARTYVGSYGLWASGPADIVHEGGMHSTYEEWTGGLQGPSYPLRDIEHQDEYYQASCALLGRTSCD